MFDSIDNPWLSFCCVVGEETSLLQCSLSVGTRVGQIKCRGQPCNRDYQWHLIQGEVNKNTHIILQKPEISTSLVGHKAQTLTLLIRHVDYLWIMEVVRRLNVIICNV